MGHDLLEQLPLRVDVFDDGLYHDIAVRDLLEVVLEVSDRNEVDAGLVIEERRGLEFQSVIDALQRQRGPGIMGLVRADSVGNDVQQYCPDPGVGEVGRNARTHHTGAQDGGFADAKRHTIILHMQNFLNTDSCSALRDK